MGQAFKSRKFPAITGPTAINQLETLARMGGGAKDLLVDFTPDNVLYTIALGPSLLYLPSVPTVCYFDEAFRAEVSVPEVLPVFLRALWALRPYWDLLRPF